MPGPFELSKYESDNGKVYPIRIQPETKTDWNPEPTGGVTEDLFAHAKFSGKKYGVFARSVTLSTTIGTGTGPFVTGSVNARVPVLSKAGFDALALGSTVLYQGVSFTVAAKHAERVR